MWVDLFQALSLRHLLLMTRCAGLARFGAAIEHRVGGAGINLDGVPVTLLDTAGVREAADAAERVGVERSQAAARAADIAILVIDAQVALPQAVVAKFRYLHMFQIHACPRTIARMCTTAVSMRQERRKALRYANSRKGSFAELPLSACRRDGLPRMRPSLMPWRLHGRQSQSRP